MKNNCLSGGTLIAETAKTPTCSVDSFHESKGIRWETPFPRLARRGFPGDRYYPEALALEWCIASNFLSDIAPAKLWMPHPCSQVAEKTHNCILRCWRISLLVWSIATHNSIEPGYSSLSGGKGDSRPHQRKDETPLLVPVRCRFVVESHAWSPSHDQCGMLRPVGTSSADWW